MTGQPADVATATEPPPDAVGPSRRASAHLVAALTAAVFAASAFLAARNSATALVAVTAAGQVALVLAWTTGMRVPGRWGAATVALAAAALVDVLVVRYPQGQLGPLLAPAGLLVLAVFAAQLTRGVVRLRVVESMSDTALLGIAVIAVAALIQLRHTLDGDESTAALMVVVGVAVMVGHLTDVLAPWPRFDPAIDRGLLATLVGAAAAAVVSYLQLHDVFGFGSSRALFLGAALGVVVGLLAVGAAFVRHQETELVTDVDPVLPSPARWRARLQPVATALWCICLSAPIGYLLVLAIGG